MAQEASTVVKQFIKDLDKVRVHKGRDGRLSLKKPLTLLLVLSWIGKGTLQANEIRFSEIEGELRELIRKFGNSPSGSTNPEEPFFYLHTAPFWSVSLDQAGGGVGARKKASATLLRKPGSFVKLSESLFDALVESASQRQLVVDHILAKWWPEGAPSELKTAATQ